jgi:hypothetical protein
VGTFIKSLLRPDIAGYWKTFFKQCVDSWVEWHNYWLTMAKAGKPIYFFRYEDLIADPRKILQEMVSFLIGEPDLKGTVAERRIDEVIALGTKAT